MCCREQQCSKITLVAAVLSVAAVAAACAASSPQGRDGGRGADASASGAGGAAGEAGGGGGGGTEAGIDGANGQPDGSGSGGSGGAAGTGDAGRTPDANTAVTGGAAGTLIQPGGLLTQAELTRIRAGVAASAEPWSAAWAAIRTRDANASYQPAVSPTITDEYALQNQGHAAYVLAIKWVASGDIAYATAARRVLDAWVNTVTSIDLTTLRTGIGAVQLANAAEIIAHAFDGGAGWPPASIARARTWFKDVVWPRIGMANLQRSSNWGTSAMAGCMAVAIFADDMAKYAYTIDAYRNGFTDAPDGCSGVSQYVCDPSGQATEAGRDQAHPQGGVAHLVEVAMMAWNQGTNLVTYADGRLVAGIEYLARYNLGNDVPYNPAFPDPCNVHPSWSTISPIGRGTFSPVYEMADKLFNLAGASHPYTLQVLSSPGYRPEATNTDHAGMGTLTR